MSGVGPRIWNSVEFPTDDADLEEHIEKTVLSEPRFSLRTPLCL